MAAGQGTNEKSNQQIIIIAQPGGGSDQKQYLLTPGGQLVQQVVVQQQVEPPLQPNLMSAESVSPQPHILRPVQNTENTMAAQGVKIAPSAGKTESSENYQLIFVQTSQEPHSNVETIASDQQNAVTRELTETVPSNDGHVVSSSHGNHTVIQATSMGEQVVSQQQVEGQQYVVMETDQPTGVYQTGDIVSLSMAASNVGQGGESEQLIEEHIVGADAAVVTSVQWS